MTEPSPTPGNRPLADVISLAEYQQRQQKSAGDDAYRRAGQLVQQRFGEGTLYVTCWACGDRVVHVKPTKKGTPHAHCYGCYTQTHTRGLAGQRWLLRHCIEDLVMHETQQEAESHG